MMPHMKVVHENLFIDCELQAMNLLVAKHLSEVLDRGLEIKPDVIIIDPLYGIATGLSRDEVGSNVAKIFTVLKKSLNCALWINHHTTKSVFDVIDGEKVPKGDPFYGAQWLKAHITGSYLMGEGQNGVVMLNKKDSHGNLLKTIELNFDEETYISTMSKSSLSIAERYKMYINAIGRTPSKTFCFEDARANLGCTISAFRSINSTPQFSQALLKHKSNGKKTLYEVIKTF